MKNIWLLLLPVLATSQLWAQDDAPSATFGGGTGGAQVFTRRNKRKNLLIIVSLAHEVIEKLRAFIPPVPEQLGVVGG